MKVRHKHLVLLVLSITFARIADPIKKNVGWQVKYQGLTTPLHSHFLSRGTNQSKLPLARLKPESDIQSGRLARAE